ncbi:MAG: hypothetical protein DMG24_22330 [Acidobacteria bacterium]|nr:MAG: hypothetical protein DMG24_22330 [Acidobacteriota bacterium]
MPCTGRRTESVRPGIWAKRWPSKGVNRVRPDMTIRMPGGLIVPVDSKAPLDALQATSEEERKEGHSAFRGVRDGLCSLLPSALR